MLRPLFHVSLWLLIASLAHAAYVVRIPVTVQQPDGTIVRCLASGDEYHNWLHDDKDYTIIQDHSNGYYVYATLKAGQLRPTLLLPGRDDPAAAGLTPGVNIPPEQWATRRAKLLAEPGPSPTVTPTTGTLNNLVLFIRFKGEPEYSRTTTSYSLLFNSSSTSANSMYNYFREVSYNKLTVVTSFYPVATGPPVMSYEDIQPRGYYRVYDATTNPIGYSTDGERTAREHGLLDRCVTAVRSQIPTTLNIDADNDGYVDNVCFVVSGSSDAWASLLWPHMWSLYSTGTYINGKRVYRYNFQLETFIDQRGNGVLCHEMLHTLGAPDLYHYSHSGTPVGPWDVMAADANPPQHPTAFLKSRYLGWISSIPQITATGKYALTPLSNSVDNCFRMASPNSTQEYFVAEYRRKTGIFENSVPGEGIIIYRINPAASGNAGGPPDEVYVYRVNGTISNNGSITDANFSSSAGRTAFSDSTNPNAYLSNNNEGGVFVSEIGFPGNTITFNYERPGIIAVTPANLVVGQQGTLTIRIAAPKSADYMVEIHDKNGTGIAPWTWNPATSISQTINAGRHATIVLGVQPLYTSETFTVNLLKRDIGGSWLIFDIQQVTLTTTGGGKGNLTVAVSDAEGWPGPWDKATVKLLDTLGTQIAGTKTNGTGIASFSSLPSGPGYSVVVSYQGLSILDEQYWGKKSGIIIPANATNNFSFVRNAPYAADLKVFIDSTNAEITGDTVRPGTRLRIELTVKNPSNAGATTSSTKVRLIVDRDRTAPFDFEKVSSYQTYSIGQTRTVSFTITPQNEGTYVYAEEVLSAISGFETTTDASVWGDLVHIMSDGPGTGDLRVTVSDAENWGGPGNTATVYLHAKSGVMIASQRTNAQSQSLFSAAPADTGYSYRVTFLSTTQISPFGEQFWGLKSRINITRGLTNEESFIRNLPYGPTMHIADSLSGTTVSGDSAKAQRPLRADIVLKNPSYAGAVVRTARGRIILDRDQQPPFDLDMVTPWVTLAPGVQQTMSAFFTPSDSATYFATGGVLTDMDGSATVTDGGNWSSRPFLVITRVNPLPPPALFMPVHASTAVPLSAQLRWHRVEGADRYHIEAAFDSLFASVIFSDSTLVDTTENRVPLLAGTQYSWRVRALGKFTSSPWSQAWQFTTVFPTPLAPMLRTPVCDTSIMSSTAPLVWFRPQRAFTFHLQVAHDSSFAMTVVNDSSIADTTHVIPLTQGRTYYWHVRSRGEGGWGPYSTLWSFNTRLAAPVQRTPANGITGVPTSVTLGWRPVANAIRYHLQAGTSSSFDSVLAVDDSTFSDTSFAVVGLARNVRYHWRVRAASALSTGPFSSVWWFHTAQIQPSTPELVYPAGNIVSTSNVVAFVWHRASPDVMRYRHEISTEATFFIATSDSGITDTTFLLTNLPNGSYWWRVQANNSAGWGQFSQARQFSVTVTGIEAATVIPTVYSLDQNYPNPFNPTTVFRFGLPVTSHATLIVYNTLGQEVRNVLDEPLEAGYHEMQFDGAGLSSGVYFYRLRAGNFVDTKRFLLIK